MFSLGIIENIKVEGKKLQSSSMMFMQSFMKISLLVQQRLLKGQAHGPDTVSLSFHIKK
jgi:hypothetical protein